MRRKSAHGCSTEILRDCYPARFRSYAHDYSSGSGNFLDSLTET